MSAELEQRLGRLLRPCNANKELSVNPKLFFFLLIVIISTPSAFADFGTSIQINGDVDSVGGGSGGTSLVHTCSSDDDLLVVVAPYLATNGGSASSATYANIAMTKVTEVHSGYRGVAIFYLVNPPAGANTVSVSLPGGYGGSSIGAYSLKGVDKTNPIDASATGSSVYSLNITTFNNNAFLIDGFSEDTSTDLDLIPGGEQSEFWDLFHGGWNQGNTASSTKYTTVAGIQNMSWSGGRDGAA